ncbi:MAG TPA: DNA recombination protein RmuC [Kiritimatiellia bacterium]|nr:DNA recombination protein RmuC [Kiritimatiellia bacterium]HPS06906.1 DNA recombination protein RmuC [Kiritimatiellia bacterium]
MSDLLLIGIAALLLAALALLAALLRRVRRADANGIAARLDGFEKGLERVERAVRDEVARNRDEQGRIDREQRRELAEALKAFGDTVAARSAEVAAAHGRQLEAMSLKIQRLSEANEARLEAVRQTVEGQLKRLQEDNAKQLELMRQTVDEKLQGTLEKRLGDSFRLVSERLEEVHKGLGEMQSLATGVGDLKKVLTNVKTRGTWGEVQLGALLEQVLSPEQYALNVATKEGGERVEFAVRLPGQGSGGDETVWLPLDAKFPMEDYQRLVEAQERADTAAVEAAGKQLENRVRACAIDISEKYLNPPKTTDFGILYLPVEGLYAEVVRRVGLTERLQREQRVAVAGPTTLWALLGSLQMGFRTLAIQKRSSEVWSLLAAVKTEWMKYGDVLDAVQKKLQQASETLDKAQVRSRAVGRRLRGVQELPEREAAALLPGDLSGVLDENDDAVLTGSEG